jgi:hypothetical protein
VPVEAPADQEPTRHPASLDQKAHLDRLENPVRQDLPENQVHLHKVKPLSQENQEPQENKVQQVNLGHPDSPVKMVCLVHLDLKDQMAQTDLLAMMDNQELPGLKDLQEAAERKESARNIVQSTAAFSSKMELDDVKHQIVRGLPYAAIGFSFYSRMPLLPFLPHFGYSLFPLILKLLLT